MDTDRITALVASLESTLAELKAEVRGVNLLDAWIAEHLAYTDERNFDGDTIGVRVTDICRSFNGSLSPSAKLDWPKDRIAEELRSRFKIVETGRKDQPIRLAAGVVWKATLPPTPTPAPNQATKEREYDRKAAYDLAKRLHDSGKSAQEIAFALMEARLQSPDGDGWWGQGHVNDLLRPS